MKKIRSERLYLLPRFFETRFPNEGCNWHEYAGARKQLKMSRTLDSLSARPRIASCLDLETFQTKNVDRFVGKAVGDRTALVANQQRPVDPPNASRRPNQEQLYHPSLSKAQAPDGRGEQPSEWLGRGSSAPTFGVAAIYYLFGFIVTETLALAEFVRSEVFAPLRPANCASPARRRFVKFGRKTRKISMDNGVTVGAQHSEVHP